MVGKRKVLFWHFSAFQVKVVGASIAKGIGGVSFYFPGAATISSFFLK